MQINRTDRQITQQLIVTDKVRYKATVVRHVNRCFVYKAWRSDFKIGNKGGRLRYRLSNSSVCSARHIGCEL